MPLYSLLLCPVLAERLHRATSSVSFPSNDPGVLVTTRSCALQLAVWRERQREARVAYVCFRAVSRPRSVARLMSPNSHNQT